MKSWYDNFRCFLYNLGLFNFTSRGSRHRDLRNDGIMVWKVEFYGVGWDSLCGFLWNEIWGNVASVKWNGDEMKWNEFKWSYNEISSRQNEQIIVKNMMKSHNCMAFCEMKLEESEVKWNGGEMKWNEFKWSYSDMLKTKRTNNNSEKIWWKLVIQSYLEWAVNNIYTIYICTLRITNTSCVSLPYACTLSWSILREIMGDIGGGRYRH